MKKILSFILFSLTICLVMTNIVVLKAADYYASVNTQSGQDLITSLHTIINTGNNNQSYDDVKSAYQYTDMKPGTNYIWDMYSNVNYTFTTDMSKNYSQEGDMYNREHVIPQSWFNEALPMRGDLFHVYPTDGYVNNKRGNLPYGEVKSATYTSGNGCMIGSSALSSYNGTVFEIIDEYKGDIARTYFYFATRYYDKISTFKNDSKVIFKSTYPYLTDYAVELFTKWSNEDPVSQKEIARNEAVYKIQKNRNPYIDHPEYIYTIFGGEQIDVTKDQAKINNVISQINTIPTTVTLADESLITSVKTLYDALNYKEKADVTNYTKLETALTALNQLKLQNKESSHSSNVITLNKTTLAELVDDEAVYLKENKSVTLDGYNFDFYANNFGFTVGTYDDTKAYNELECMQSKKSTEQFSFYTSSTIKTITLDIITSFINPVDSYTIKGGVTSGDTSVTPTKSTGEPSNTGKTFTKNSKTSTLYKVTVTYTFPSDVNYIEVWANSYAIYCNNIEITCQSKTAVEVNSTIKAGLHVKYQLNDNNYNLDYNYNIKVDLTSMENGYTYYLAASPAKMNSSLTSFAEFSNNKSIYLTELTDDETYLTKYDFKELHLCVIAVKGDAISFGKAKKFIRNDIILNLISNNKIQDLEQKGALSALKKLN